MRAIRKSSFGSHCNVTKTIGRSGAFEVKAEGKTVHSKLQGISQGRNTMAWPVEQAEISGILDALKILAFAEELTANRQKKFEETAKGLAEQFKSVMHLSDSYYMQVGHKLINDGSG